MAARIGFAPETLAVAGDSVAIRLHQTTVTLDSLVVAADPAFSTASSRVIRSLDLQLRPRESSQELLRLAPGLVIAQHAGGGKAEQIFLRGFDADHGTDVAISVDGTPVNLVSHAHGQGYADLHFLIPEVLDEIEVRKGPYDAQDGDLATAGAVAFQTKDRIGHGRVETRGGSFNTVHGLALVPFGGDVAHAGGYLAASAHYTRGPFLASQDYRRVNGWLGVVSPKASLAIDLAPGMTLFTNAGLGFHSNDARDVVTAPAGETLLPRAAGAELGVRRTWSSGSLAVALWGLDLESELVYVGDEGKTEASGRTRRLGIDLEGRARVLRWLWADGDLNLSRGWFRNEPHTGNRIPLAPTVTATGGLTLRDVGRASGGFRVRHVGARAANETNTIRARGYTVAELFGAYEVGAARIFGSVDNLFGARWNEAQFVTTSRLQAEPEPVTELHFTPGARRGVQLGVGYRF